MVNDKIPNLELLNLSFNNFSGGYLGYLFGKSDIVLFRSLRKLDIRGTELNKSDLDILSQAIGEDKIPQLHELQISRINSFTESLNGILDSISQHLVEIKLVNEGLGDADLKRLCSAITGKKFLKLKTLALSCNTLTNHIGQMFCATDEVVLPCLLRLALIETALNKTDLKSLSESVRSGKLPLLTWIHLAGNDLLLYYVDTTILMF